MSILRLRSSTSTARIYNNNYKLQLPLVAALLLLAHVSVASQAMTNLADSAAAWDCFAAYTNNELRIEAVEKSEWDPTRRLDRLPFDMPFQLVVGPDEADRVSAEAAVATVTTSMPTHIRAYFTKHHLMAPLLQRMIRRYKPGITNEDSYVTAAAHSNVWRAKDFDLERLSAAAKNLTSNDVPMMANLRPIYEEFKSNPIRRAEPLVDYPDPRPEETYATPFGVAVVLRAVEQKRKFRFRAVGYPFAGQNVSFKWMSTSGGVGIRRFPCEDPGQRRAFSPECGCGELTLDRWSRRRDVLVFARYGDGSYGPPSLISFYPVPNELRKYERDGRILSVEYLRDKPVLPKLYQYKPWSDDYLHDTQGNVVGYLRTRVGQFREERFNWLGEYVVETYAGDQPKTTRKVRYFTRPDDPATLDYEITGESVQYKFGVYVPRTRGEFPMTRSNR